MQRCPRCGETRAWRLGDGRLKCKTCGLRYSGTSAWDSVRLPEEAKRQLLERFVTGEPAYRQRLLRTAAPASRERFNRLVRACCTMAGDGEWATERAATAATGTPAERIVAFELAERDGLVGISAAEEPLPAAPASRGELQRLGDRHARIVLKTHGGRIAMRKGKPSPPRDEGDLIGRFWDYARDWLRPYRGIPQRYFPLYLGEACYRFNHRGEELGPLLLELMRTTPVQVLRPLLAPRPRGTAPGGTPGTPEHEL